jgi:dinuclear metal center YbgI/SA1388 family protein
MKIKDITNYIEQIAPLSYQESYDNSGLIVGDAQKEVTKVLLCLDSIENIVDEAIEKKCELIIAHHPIVFLGLKKFNGKNYIERVVIKAIKHDIAIYACHTNLDNVFNNGVNEKIAQKIGLQNTRILTTKKGLLKKLITFVPEKQQEQVREAIFNAGAGEIGNYDQCSFNSKGEGTFRANNEANPFVGEKVKQHKEQEIKVEVVFPAYLESKIVSAIIKTHPYEEVAYDLYELTNTHNYIGSGIIGELKEPTNSIDFLTSLKTTMDTKCVRYTNPHKKEVKTIAICGGAGSFLLNNAIAQQADVFITGDYKYHQFFDAEDKIIIADIGHYESEQFTVDLFKEVLEKEFETLKVVKTSLNTNPVNYL